MQEGVLECIRHRHQARQHDLKRPRSPIGKRIQRRQVCDVVTAQPWGERLSLSGQSPGQGSVMTRATGLMSAVPVSMTDENLNDTGSTFYRIQHLK